MNTFDFLAEHGASVLFWVVFVEQIGLPLPALPLLVAAGALVGAGKMSLAAALLLPIAASLPPDLAWYYLGRHKGGKVLGVSLPPVAGAGFLRTGYGECISPERASRIAVGQIHSWIQHCSASAGRHCRHARGNVCLVRSRRHADLGGG